MQLTSVNIGQVCEIEYAKESGITGIYKEPVAGPVQITALGLMNGKVMDAIVDTENHGGYDQAVYVYGGADYAWWTQNLGFPVAPGTFGDNLTISDLESAKFSAGDRLHIGAQVILEVTAPRIPCATLAARMKDPLFVKRFMKGQRPGLYCRVIQEGSVQAGDPVTLEPYRGETVTVMEMFRNFSNPRPSQDYLRRFLNAPTPLRGRDGMEAKYKGKSAA